MLSVHRVYGQCDTWVNEECIGLDEGDGDDCGSGGVDDVTGDDTDDDNVW